MHICFVCLGNICRSPMAEGIAQALARQKNLNVTISSAGTSGWHTGKAPDSRMQKVAKQHDIDLSVLRASQVSAQDDLYIDLFVAMDETNYQDLKQLFGKKNVRIVKLLDEHPGRVRDVPDPYYGGPGGFEDVYQLIAEGVQYLFARLFPESFSKDSLDSRLEKNIKKVKKG